MYGEDQVPSLGRNKKGENKQIVGNVMAVRERRQRKISFKRLLGK
jgi:hypothetical protein